jgi:hypothetical protein
MRHHWRYTMTRSSEPIDGDSDRERDGNSYQVVYLVKRPTYEFIYAVPEVQAPSPSGSAAVFQVHVRNQPQGQRFRLDLQGLEDFYESLGGLLEYVHTEQQKRRGA